MAVHRYYTHIGPTDQLHTHSQPTANDQRGPHSHGSPAVKLVITICKRTSRGGKGLATAGFGAGWCLVLFVLDAGLAVVMMCLAEQTCRFWSQGLYLRTACKKYVVLVVLQEASQAPRSMTGRSTHANAAPVDSLMMSREGATKASRGKRRCISLGCLPCLRHLSYLACFARV
jgi:hypothetical protein